MARAKKKQPDPEPDELPIDGDEFVYLAMKRLEDYRLTKSRREKVDMENQVRRGELLEAWEVKSRTAAAGLALRNGIETGRRELESATTPDCRLAVLAGYDAAMEVATRAGHCQVNRIHSEISANCRWLLYEISMA